jgi:hypothetical protein
MSDRDAVSDRDSAFAEYFTARSDAMRGTAYLLCGDWHGPKNGVAMGGA